MTPRPAARPVRVGDPDPTPNVGPYCGAIDLADNGNAPYPCTLRPHHKPDNPHVDGDCRVVRRVWTGSRSVR